MSIRALAIRIGFAYIGKWYKWGGDDPSGFDCSGFIVEILQSVGLINTNEDLTAKDLWNRFLPCKITDPRPGALVFWKDSSGSVNHVELCISTQHSIGAKGGDSQTLTVEDAITKNAFIKIRPIDSRPRLHGCLDPFMAFNSTEVFEWF